MSIVTRVLSRTTFDENLIIALDNLRASKLRSGLTILGVVIGVATVMTMASIVRGIQSQIVNAIEVAGPSTFYVMKVFSTSPVNPDRLPSYIRIRPDLRPEEAERIATLPQIQYAGIWAQIQGRLEYAGERTRPMIINGADDHYQDIMGGELVSGRWFTRAEMRSGAAVAVIDEGQARRIFGRIDPIGKTMQLAGRPVEVIGLVVPPENIFTPPGTQNAAVVPFVFMDHGYTIDRTNALFICVKPKAGVTVTEAEEEVTIAMREMRKLRPRDHDNFDLISQDQILNLFNTITGTFFLVMIVLASVALMVGGIGVMAIMMVSVTARTREIGIRKALGATRRDILMQFLIEAATLTGLGGVLGIAVGLGAGRLLNTLMAIHGGTPIGLTLIAIAVSVGIGLVFGVIPARRAAHLDPVEALRYE